MRPIREDRCTARRALFPEPSTTLVAAHAVGDGTYDFVFSQPVTVVHAGSGNANWIVHSTSPLAWISCGNFQQKTDTTVNVTPNTPVTAANLVMALAGSSAIAYDPPWAISAGAIPVT